MGLSSFMIMTLLPETPLNEEIKEMIVELFKKLNHEALEKGMNNINIIT